MDYDKIPYVAARKAAESREWEAPSGLTVDCLKNLSGGARVPLGEVIYLLAFGPSMSSAEYSDSSIEAMTARLVAAEALFRAASNGKVLVYGQHCQRLTEPFMGSAMVQCVAPFGQRQIAAAEFADDKLTLSPVKMDWICLATVAAKPELWAQPDDWRFSCNVCYFNIEVDRAFLSKWIGDKLRTKARYTAAKRELILKSVDELGPVPDGLLVQEQNSRIIEKARELSGNNKFTADPKTIRNALRSR
jgi:hypothetical protein